MQGGRIEFRSTASLVRTPDRHSAGRVPYEAILDEAQSLRGKGATTHSPRAAMEMEMEMEMSDATDGGNLSTQKVLIRLRDSAIRRIQPDLVVGYDIYAVMDASGTWNKLVREVAIARMTQAGIQPITWVAVGAELRARRYARTKSGTPPAPRGACRC